MASSLAVCSLPAAGCQAKRTSSNKRQATTAALAHPKPAAQAAVALAAAMALAAASPAPAMGVGESVFTNNCAACHSGGQNVVQPEKTLFKASLEQYLEGGYNVDAIKYQVINGKNAMPAWEDRLDEDEIDAVAKYVYEKAGAGW
eukprot:jgi/Chlat1/1451/Chrsp12S02004